MCLISKNRFAKKAKTNIVCYKAYYYEGEGKYSAPFLRDIVDINKEVIKAEGVSFSFYKPYEKSVGYIHVFKYLLNNYKIKCYFGENNSPNIRIFRCIIPKGTKYHISTNGYEYCAKKIIIKELMPSYKYDKL